LRFANGVYPKIILPHYQLERRELYLLDFSETSLVFLFGQLHAPVKAFPGYKIGRDLFGDSRIGTTKARTVFFGVSGSLKALKRPVDSQEWFL
jgi:hypothetical protein